MRTDCGELSGPDYDKAADKIPDSTGDPYEDYPEDQGAELSGEQILKIASELKDLGNKAFKGGDNIIGLAKYEKGVRYLHEYPAPQDNDPPELGQQLTSLKFSLYNNSALLQNKMQDYEGAVKSASYALNLEGIGDADRGKAYFRRAQARSAKKANEEAIKDFEEAQKLVPGDAAIKRELETATKRLAERKKKEKAAYKKFFD